MHLRIHISGTEPTEGMRSFIEWRLEAVLRSVRARLGVVDVRVIDGRANDGGGVTCEIQVHREPAPSAVVRMSGRDVHSVLDAAAERVLEALGHRGPVRTPSTL